MGWFGDSPTVGCFGLPRYQANLAYPAYPAYPVILPRRSQHLGLGSRLRNPGGSGLPRYQANLAYPGYPVILPRRSQYLGLGSRLRNPGGSEALDHSVWGLDCE